MIFEIKLNGTIYKSINKGMIKKVLEYVVIDDKRVNSNEWNKEINSQEELTVFATNNELIFN